MAMSFWTGVVVGVAGTLILSSVLAVVLAYFIPWDRDDNPVMELGGKENDDEPSGN